MTDYSGNTFGPTLIKGLGFSTQTSSLLNIPFGGLQAIGILAGSWAAARFKIKSVMLIILCLFTLAGGVMMYVAESGDTRQQTLALVGYYFLAFSFGCSPVVYSWAIANVGGVSPPCRDGHGQTDHHSKLKSRRCCRL